MMFNQSLPQWISRSSIEIVNGESQFTIFDLRFTQLTFRELESRTGTLLPVFLAFLLTRVTRDEARLFQCRTQVRIKFHQRTRNAVTHGTGLSGLSAAVDIDVDVKFLIVFRQA